MGYTHSWKGGKASPEQWQRALTRARKAIKIAKEEHGIELCCVGDDDDPPILDEKRIKLNGLGETGHETFHLLARGEEFAFCKTASKSYDLLVTAILVIAEEEYGLEVTSDGDRAGEDWAHGLALAKKTKEEGPEAEPMSVSVHQMVEAGLRQAQALGWETGVRQFAVWKNGEQFTAMGRLLADALKLNPYRKGARDEA